MAALVIMALGWAAVVSVGRNARAVARTDTCVSNLAQLSLALRMYADDNGGRMPPGERWAAPVNAYVENERIFRCSEEPAREGSRAAVSAPAGGGPEIVSYVIDPRVRTDDLPSTLVVADDAPDRHPSRTWNGARLDGAVRRFRAADWHSYWGEVTPDDEAP